MRRPYNNNKREMTPAKMCVRFLGQSIAIHGIGIHLQLCPWMGEFDSGQVAIAPAPSLTSQIDIVVFAKQLGQSISPELWHVWLSGWQLLWH